MQKRVTLQDIADRLNITKVSVSKAINNQPGISEELRKRILSLAYETGYLKAGGNQMSKADSFAFIVQHKFFLTENESFYSTIYYHLNSICMANKKNLFLYVINPKDEENSILQQINKGSIEGIFIAGEIKEAYLHMLVNIGIPMIFIDFNNPHFQNDCILVDNFNISYYATTYLIDRGHKKLGFIGNMFSSSNVLDRFYGFQKALLTYRLEYRDDWILSNYNPETGYHVLDFQIPGEMPTAFVCHCDMSAYFLIQKLNSLGVSVPEDISVISFDNTALAQTCNPPLTSVDISKQEFAVLAFDMLNSRICHPKNDVRQVYINTKICERDSVKALK